jgi:hypothetical protein
MTATLVIHTRDIDRHPGAVYIGREHAGRGRGPSFKRSRWAKPCTWHEHGREAAVDLYTRWINGDPDAAAMLPPGKWQRPSVEEIRQELRGRVLACWCAPERCHGHVLAAIADDDTPGGEVPPGNHES